LIEADDLADLAVGIECHHVGATGNGRRILGGELPAPVKPVVVLVDLPGQLEEESRLNCSRLR
jgi:hypothetical protein